MLHVASERKLQGIFNYYYYIYIRDVGIGGEPTRNTFHRNIFYFTFCGSLMEITSSTNKSFICCGTESNVQLFL